MISSYTKSVTPSAKLTMPLHYGMAQISDRSYEHLSTVQANYIRPKTLQDASDLINNAVAALPNLRHYHIQEDVLHASTDGQKFETHLETFKTRYSSKYFGTNKGITAMTLVANHNALNARIIGANEHESHYIYDLLQSNTCELKPDVLSMDTPDLSLDLVNPCCID
jgi:hypothetical protein